MSLTIRITMLVMILFVYQDRIGSEKTTMDADSLTEGVTQIWTATPDGDNFLITTRAQTVVSDVTSYSTIQNPLDENPISTRVSNEEDSRTNIETSTTVKGSSTADHQSNEDLSGFTSTTEQNSGSVVPRPSAPVTNDFPSLENTPRREPDYTLTTEEPKAIVTESGAYEDSTDAIELNTKYDGLVSETEEEMVIANGSATSANSSDVKNSETANDGLISEEVWNAFNDVAGDLWLPFCAIGIVANILNIIVFTDRQMRNATNYYLAAISVFQISYIISSTVTNIHQLIHGDIGQRSTKFYYIGAIYINNYIGVVFSRAVFCMVMIVSFERMMAIVFPMRRARSRLVKSPILLTFCLIIVLFLFHLNAVLKYSVEPQNENGKISYDLKPRGYDMNVLNNLSFVSKICFVYIPLVSILICNTILCVALKRHSQSRNNLHEGSDDNRREARERQTTIAILVSTFVFFLLVLPITTNSIVSNLVSGYSYFGSRYTFLFMQLAGSMFQLLSYFSDFITYVTISSKYRNTLVRKCCPCLMTSRMLNSGQSKMKKSASTTQSIYSVEKG